MIESQDLERKGSTDSNKWFKFVILFFLFVAYNTPVMFFATVFPVMLRKSGAPLQRIGLFGLFVIPTFLKFLWAPFVDKYGNNKFGHYKSWLITIQLICIPIGVTIAFLNFADQFWWIMGVGILYAVFLSTLLIAVNGFAVQCLTEKERPLGNSTATLGWAFGSITGGTMLILVDKIGYASTLLLTFIPFIISCILLLFYKEPFHPEFKGSIKFLSSFAPLKNKSFRRWLLLINLCNIGDSMIYAMVQPMLVDKGLSFTAIGLMSGTFRTVFAMLGAIICAPLIKRLARKTSLVSFMLANTVLLALFILPAMNITNNSFLYFIFAATGFITSFKWTLIYSIFMDYSRKSSAATDFAVQVSVISIGIAIYNLASGYLASAVGYTSLFSISIALDIVAIIILGIYYRDAEVDVTDVREELETAVEGILE